MFAASTAAGLYAGSIITFVMAVAGTAHLATTFRRPRYQARHMAGRR